VYELQMILSSIKNHKNHIKLKYIYSFKGIIKRFKSLFITLIIGTIICLPQSNSISYFVICLLKIIIIKKTTVNDLFSFEIHFNC
jgi:hypothetical protein